MQLNLFEHAPRHYYESLTRLGRVDLEGCRQALALHRVDSPAGPDPEPMEHAVAWLASRLPDRGAPTQVSGQRVLDICRSLRRGDQGIPPLLRPAGEVARNVVRALAQQMRQLCKTEGIPPENPLDGDLAWGVFWLFAERAPEARTALLSFLRSREPTAAACLALGEACTQVGRGDEAVLAWREGYGLDPWGRSWAPTPPWIEEIRLELNVEPLYRGAWWAVGAYLEGQFPRYERAEPALVVQRWQRFLRACHGRRTAGAPSLFFSGLFLSEQGADLPVKDLRLVRKTLSELQPELYELHRERLEEFGPPEPFLGKGYMAW